MHCLDYDWNGKLRELLQGIAHISRRAGDVQDGAGAGGSARS